MENQALVGSSLGSSLQQLLMSDDIEPGSQASYQLAKTIYVFHPLGAKIAEEPIKIAQSQEREITISLMPGLEERLKKQWQKQWEDDRVEQHIFNTAVQARVYGIASLCVVSDEIKPADPLPLDKIANTKIAFNVLDPLNTAGSLVLDQRPNSTDFQKIQRIAINGTEYHRSRAVALMNENPIYIEYTASAFGYVGRSAYQRALFPLKSYVQSMVTDDMVTKKAGIIVATLQAAGSIIDRVMLKFADIKRNWIKQAATDNVISIGEKESISAIDLTNTNTAMDTARRHIIENIAAAVPMPARLLNHETLAEGFGEGTEDAKAEALYINGVRKWIQPLYAFMDPIVQRRAFNEEFFNSLKNEFPDEFADEDYQTWYYRVVNSFKAVWPNLLTEPDSEKVKVEDARLRATVAVVQILAPMADPENKARLIEWLQDVLNNQKLLFGVRLDLDIEALANYTPPAQASPVEGSREHVRTMEGSYRPRADAMEQYAAAFERMQPPRVAKAA